MEKETNAVVIGVKATFPRQLLLAMKTKEKKYRTDILQYIFLQVELWTLGCLVFRFTEQ